MLTREEEQFLESWKIRRLEKGFRFTPGWPAGIIVVLALFVNILTGWHKRAVMVLRANTAVVLVIVVAAIAIVIFFTIFSARYQREQKEQRYQELLARKAASDMNNSSIN